MAVAVSAGAAERAHTRVDLLAEDAWIQPGRPFWVAVRLRMDEGWHTYWKNPGDSGQATRVQWDLPEAFLSDSVEWPVPEKIELPSVVNFGYQGEVSLLAKITPPAKTPSRSVVLKARVEWMECAQECVPGAEDVVLSLPVKKDVPVPNDGTSVLFAQARLRLPVSAPEWNLEAIGGEGKIRLNVFPPPGVAVSSSELYFFPEKGGGVEPGASQKLSRSRESYRLDLIRSEVPVIPDVLRGVLVFSGEAAPVRGLTVDVPVTPGAVADGEPGWRVWLWIIVAVGLLFGWRRFRKKWAGGKK